MLFSQLFLLLINKFPINIYEDIFVNYELCVYRVHKKEITRMVDLTRDIELLRSDTTTQFRSHSWVWEGGTDGGGRMGGALQFFVCLFGVGF